MKLLIILFTLLSFNLSSAQEGQKIKSMSKEIDQRIQSFGNYSQLTKDERRSIRAELIFLKELLDDLGIDGSNAASDFICAKQNNGRFYPVNIDTYQIVGDTGYNASYPNVDSCKDSLPMPGDIMACAKKNNGRFYPVELGEFMIMGDTGYNASFANFATCKGTLPSFGDKVTCSKKNNGRFYPVSVETYEILGDTGYNASYPTFEACSQAL